MVKGSAKLVIILNTVIPNGEIIADDIILNGFYDRIKLFLSIFAHCIKGMLKNRYQQPALT